MKTLRFKPKNKEYCELIIIDKIVRFSKSEDGETTYIHLINGEIIASEDSVNTIEAKIASL